MPMFSVPSSWNNPPFIAAAGIATAVGLPFLEKWCMAAPLSQLKLLQAGTYALNVIATSCPGRIDGQVALKQNSEKSKENEKKEGTTKDDEVADNFLSDRRGKSLVTPDSWTFSIWGPIFMGELAYCIFSYGLQEGSDSSHLVPLVRKAAGGFIASQIFQTLWCTSFRPKYKEMGQPWMFISSFMLSGIALSLNRAHTMYCGAQTSLIDYVKFFAPLTMHFGWTTAAALVDWNGSLSLLPSMNAQNMAMLGHASVALATSVGVGITWQRQAPVVGLVIAWALLGLASGMVRRIMDVASNTGKSHQDVDNAERPGHFGARRQQWLCLIGAVMSLVASGLTYQQRFGDKHSMFKK